MKKVLLQAKVLAETIVESEVFQKMHNAELALSQNSDANLAIMKVMEKRSAVEGMLASNDMDNVALAAAARELEDAEKAMNEIPAIAELQANRQAFSEMMECSNRYSIPLLRTKEATSVFMSSLIKHLNVELAPETTLHGVLVEIYGEGVLILGDSGVGKSETAMEIVKRGHRLIADDLVEVRRVSDTTLLGRAPDIIRHLIEIRGLGILDVKELYGVSAVKNQDTINFVINLELWDEKKVYERLGISEEFTEILGIKVPSITIPVRPGRNLAIIAEVAAINFRQKQMGYNAAQALTDRLFGAADKRRREEQDS